MNRYYQARPDLTRNTFAVLFVCALLVVTGWIVLPFLSASLWAATIVISTWPMLLRVQSKVGGRRGLATTVMVTALLAVVVIPLGLATAALIGNMDTIVAKASALQTLQLPPPPDWVARIPIRGPKVAAEWQRLAAEGPGSLAAVAAPSGGRLLGWFAARVGGAGGMALQFLLAVILSAILYMQGETAARGVRKFAARLAGANGERAAVLAASTIRAVAMGVIVTDLVQTAIATVGLLAVSMPGAGLLAAAVLMLCVAQLGPVLVMLPAVIWKFHSGDSVGGFVLLAFSLVAGTIDNFLRPLLIRRGGASLPLLIIFGGVIGGMIGFGVMGIFVGPATLAVAWVLVREWVNMDPEPEREAATTERSKMVGL
jgi:predicted PurR-regulated permease PerM